MSELSFFHLILISRISSLRPLERGAEKVKRRADLFLSLSFDGYVPDASQLYSTQHETASTVKAVINLEAAGTTGQEMLFQATSSELVEVRFRLLLSFLLPFDSLTVSCFVQFVCQAYSKVPYPHGTVLAADVFASGM